MPELTDKEKLDKIAELVSMYGGIDGGHYKQWILDQIMRTIYQGDEYRARVIGDGSDWDTGIAP